LGAIEICLSEKRALAKKVGKHWFGDLEVDQPAILRGWGVWFWLKIDQKIGSGT